MPNLRPAAIDGGQADGGRMARSTSATTSRYWTLLGSSAVLAVTVCAVAVPGAASAGPATGAAGPEVAAVAGTPVATLLHELVVSEERQGQMPSWAWTDQDGDGCDTREEVLLRDSLTPASTGAGCEVTAGSWDVGGPARVTDPTVLTAAPTVGAVETAESGAYGWDPMDLVFYRNDLEPGRLQVRTLEQVATLDGTDPGDLVLDRSEAECRRLTAWVVSKYRWRLEVDLEELLALRTLVGRPCATVTTVPAREKLFYPTFQRTALQPGNVLPGDQGMISPRGDASLQMSSGGDLQLVGPGGIEEWRTGTAGDGNRFVFQADGNLVVADRSGRALWWSGTRGLGGDLLLLQDDGNLVLYRTDGVPVWASGTVRPPRDPSVVPPVSRGPGEIPFLTSLSGGDRFGPSVDGPGYELRRAGALTWRPVLSRPSAPGSSRMVLQDDGNLVLSDPAGVLWHAGTRGSAGLRLTLQDWDGNLVLYRGDGRGVWSAQTGLVRPSSLGTDVQLSSGTVMPSPSGEFRAVVQADGNLVVYGPGGQVRWHAGTFGQGSVRLLLQGDGNLVLSSESGRPLWWTATDGRGGRALLMQDDGNLVLSTAEGRPVWSTVTGRL